MSYSYDKDLIKNELTLDQIAEIVSEFHGEPIKKGETLICKTICHNSFDNLNNASHKLYYYDNTHLFRCYTGCAEPTFDIFELTRKVLSREQPKPREDSEWNLPEAIDFIAKKFGFSPNEVDFDEEAQNHDDLKLFEKYDRIKNIDINTQEVELKEYEDNFLKNLPHPKIQPWIDEGISEEVMRDAEICYDPKNQGIVIPHRDINNRLIGIRERTLIQEQAELYGKYLPAKLGGKMYNHPLSFNVYNLNKSKKNISRFKKAFVFEGEKSCLLYRTYFGPENDISTAICGSSFIAYQAWLLINQGAEEIIVGLDKQFQDKGDKEFNKLVKNLKNIHKKYGQFAKISFLFDKENLLGYKDAPVDKGIDIFIELYKRRVNLYD